MIERSGNAYVLVLVCSPVAHICVRTHNIQFDKCIPYYGLCNNRARRKIVGAITKQLLAD